MNAACRCPSYLPLEFRREDILRRIGRTKRIMKTLEVLADDREQRVALYRCRSCGAFWQSAWQWGLGPNGCDVYLFQVPEIPVDDWLHEHYQQPAAMMMYTFAMSSRYGSTSPPERDVVCDEPDRGRKAIRFSIHCLEHDIAHGRSAGSVPKEPSGRMFPPYRVAGTTEPSTTMLAAQPLPAKRKGRRAALDRRVKGLKAAYSAMVNLAPKVSKRMREAAESARYRVVTTVEYHLTDEGRKPFERNRELRGWELWDEPPSVTPLQVRLHEIRDEILEERAKDDKLNEPHERLATRLRRLHSDIRPIEEWADLASGFFFEGNLRLVVDDTKQTQLAEVSGNSLVVRDEDQRVRIDANGRTKVPA